ncbi:MAG: TspO/MBR family protein [Clostridia bacterium]|nr:TspO/MBR family protein [Clostridia bacterium]
MIKIKPLIISIAISLAVGILSGFLTMGAMQNYEVIQKPMLSPAPIIFPIVWTILFVLMGISAYRVYVYNDTNDKNALWLYAVQLAVNFIWPFIFFNAQQYLIAFIWLIILWILVLLMIIKFYKIDRISAYLQIPYIIWLTFAAYLNCGVYMLNM